ncbi:pectate lyase [Arcticibacter pallidicorallinus]|uniref:Pectate lyase n=1 Tax=Arcticibacter pallidicorallinus TaxID=1259464 RepID=A0A2T0U3W2_9SPHI|nr:pectate lyase [Arcticibacter pallidicorallinus]PRY52596.1 pectate lyase [Arcticibacter pallidicorallinus]
MAPNFVRSISLSILLLTLSLLSQAQQIAFPGAEGYGKFTTGGRGGRVIEVTNLKGDESPGSLRAAFKTPGSDPITIVFRVSGNIGLTDGQVKVGRSNMTIAGQTAPGEGICIKDGYLKFSGSNLIIRFMRFRPGDAAGLSDLSCLGNENSQNVIIDHCSLSWSNEESHTCYDNKYITVQWCILSESLYKSFDSKGARSYAAQWGGQYASYHHNLIASNVSRSPRVNGSRSHDTVALCDYRNNVIYNWGKLGAVYGGELEVNDPKAGCYINWVNNYYKPGPATASDHFFAQPSYESRKDAAKGYAKWYFSGNFMEGGIGSLNGDNWKGVDMSKVGSAENIRSLSEFEVERPHTETAKEAYQSVLLKSGAIFPTRDAIDTRVVNEASGKIKHSGSGTYGRNKGIIDTQKSVGGWPELKSSKPPVDSDHDGMPDEWEIKNKLNPKYADDRNLVAQDGYTMLEKYINSLAV